jgi:hypothetical protein
MPAEQGNTGHQTVPTTDGQGTQQTPAAQPTPQSFWNGDPNQLAPDLQAIYKNMQADYVRKTQEIAARQREYEAQLARARDIEQAYNNLYGQYQQQLQNWQQWAPTLQRLADPAVWSQVESILTGQQSSQATPASIVGDDEFVTGAVLANRLNQFASALVNGLRTELAQALGQTVREQMQWIQNYHQLSDELRRLEMEHLYGLTPRENAAFDARELLRTAAEKGLTDLRSAYQLRYGSDQIRQRWEEERKRIEQEAFERGRKEAEMEARNRQLGIIPGTTAPKLEFKKEPSSYKEVEQTLAQKLASLGMRP